MVLAFFSNLMGGLTHYGFGSTPVFCGANYASLSKMVGLRIPHIYCQHSYLARSWGGGGGWLVEVHCLQVKQLVIRISRPKV